MVGNAVVQSQEKLQDWFEMKPRSPLPPLVCRVC